MNKTIQIETAFSKAMDVITEMENSFRKETRRGRLSYLSKPEARRNDYYLGVCGNSI